MSAPQFPSTVPIVVPNALIGSGSGQEVVSLSAQNVSAYTSLNASTVPTVVPNALPALANYINNDTPVWAASGAGGGSSTPFAQGMVMLWDKVTAIPTGWALCDGSTVNGYVTPTIQNVFVVATGTTYPTCGLGGGASSVNLVIDNLPNHQHLGIPIQTAGVAEGSGGGYAVDGTQDTGLISGYNTQLPVSTLPPYYSMTYICYVGVP